MGYEKSKLQGKRKANKGGNGAEHTGRVSFGNYEFVRIEITAEERRQFKEMLESGEFSATYQDELIGAGYKVTYSTDPKGGGVICSISNPVAETLNAGCILTGRGETSLIALYVTQFKDVYLCGDDGWKAAEIRRGGFNDMIG